MVEASFTFHLVGATLGFLQGGRDPNAPAQFAGRPHRRARGQKALAASMQVATNGIQLTAGADFTVDDTTGVVTLAVPPALGAAITAALRSMCRCGSTLT